MIDENKPGAMIQKILKGVSELKAAQIIMGGYATVIFVGLVLLCLPVASVDGKSVGFINALFTSTSATCVTGLAVHNTLTHWSFFGKVVILLLIQVGGMGFMTLITMIMVIAGKKITLKERLLIQESLNQNDLKGLVKLVKKVVFGTLILEGIAGIILGIRFMFEKDTSFLVGLWKGIFHSISAFNNAGFDIVGESSLEPYVGDPLINIVIMVLIILGGLGYAVWLDVISVFKQAHKNENLNLKYIFQKLSLHSKIVFEITLALIIFGFLFFIIFEFNNAETLGKLSFFDKIWAALFQSVSPRTAGFASINQAGLSMESKFMTFILMFIGGSPGGTAGGVKTVTMGVLFASVLSMIKGRDELELHNKCISFDFLKKSLSVIILNLTVLVVGTMILSISEKNTMFGGDFMAIFFEVGSAVGTVGLSLGVTPYLSFIGKIVLCICMFIGRVGPITVVVGFTVKKLAGKKGIHYPEEKIFVG